MLIHQNVFRHLLTLHQFTRYSLENAYMCPWSTKAVLSRWGIFSQKYIAWVKIINFSFMPKIISILSKDHVP